MVGRTTLVGVDVVAVASVLFVATTGLGIELSLGVGLTERTRQAIARAESAAQGITLLLASPDFQRR